MLDGIMKGLVDSAMGNVLGGAGGAAGAGAAGGAAAAGGAGGIGGLLGGLLGGGGGGDMLGGLLGGGGMGLGIGKMVNGLCDSLGLPDYIGDLAGVGVDAAMGNVPGAISNGMELLPEVTDAIDRSVNDYKSTASDLGDMYAGDLSDVAGDVTDRGTGVADALGKGLGAGELGSNVVDMMTAPDFLTDLGCPESFHDAAKEILEDLAGGGTLPDGINPAIFMEAGMPEDVAAEFTSNLERFANAQQLASENPGLAQTLMGTLGGMNTGEAVGVSDLRSEIRM